MDTNNNNAMVYMPINNWNEIEDFMRQQTERMNKIDVDVLKPKEYISVGDFLESFSIGRSFFDDLRRDGKIKTYKIRGKILLKLTEVRKVFESARE